MFGRSWKPFPSHIIAIGLRYLTGPHTLQPHLKRPVRLAAPLRPLSAFSSAYTTGTMPPSEFPASAPGPPHPPATLLTDNLEKPSLDDRDYRVIRLGNTLEALIVHDPKTDKASASLDVNVGNFSDETGMPGMAHAVEHVSITEPSSYKPLLPIRL